MIRLSPSLPSTFSIAAATWAESPLARRYGQACAISPSESQTINVLTDDASAYLGQLQEHGVVLLRRVFPLNALAAVRRAAQACFEAAEGGTRKVFPEMYRYNPLSRSVLVGALQDFGCSAQELSAPLATAGLDALLAGALGAAAGCHLEQSWVRKRYAPFHAPTGYHPNSWHQDGGLGISFLPRAESACPMTRLLTCWLPLDPCTGDRPALEFVRRRLDRLVHYTELDDAILRRRFAPFRTMRGQTRSSWKQ
jgi:hypothetical protein